MHVKKCQNMFLKKLKKCPKLYPCTLKHESIIDVSQPPKSSRKQADGDRNL